MDDDRIEAVIEDGPLRRLALDRSARTAPVLIEVAPSGAEAVEIRLGGATVGRPAAVDGAVRTVLGHAPRYLRAAHSYAAVATGAQLAALAALPGVAAIRPDRTLRPLGR